jgi:hypothetical protein
MRLAVHPNAVHLRRQLALRVEDAEIEDLLNFVGWRLGSQRRGHNRAAHEVFRGAQVAAARNRSAGQG